MDHNYDDDIDIWFNELDEKTIDVLNPNLIIEENSPDPPKNNKIAKNETVFSFLHDDDVANMNGIEQIFVEDMIKKDPNDLKALHIMQYESSIAQFIRGLMDGNQPNKIRTIKKCDLIDFDKMSDIIEYLKWISNASKILAERIGQELIIHDSSNSTPKIIRSSYNFCSKYTKCKNYYNFDDPTTQVTCNEHHFVHSVLKNDIDSIINYLTYALTNKIELSLENVNDFQLSIKTIGFVTKHMAKEIRLVDVKTMGNSELHHRNNIFKKTKNWVFDVSLEKNDSVIKSEHVPVTEFASDDVNSGPRVSVTPKSQGSPSGKERYQKYVSRTSLQEEGKLEVPTPIFTDGHKKLHKHSFATKFSRPQPYNNDKYNNDRYNNDRYNNDRYNNDRYNNDKYNNKCNFPRALNMRENNDKKTAKNSNRYEILNNLTY